MSSMTVTEFDALFPDDDTCLDYLRDRVYPAGEPCPKCGQATKFHRVSGRTAYSCQYCRHQIYPTAQTIFHRSSTSLRHWFQAIRLVNELGEAVQPKQLEKLFGVSPRTARRMLDQIQTLPLDPTDPLGCDIAHGTVVPGESGDAVDPAGLVSQLQAAAAAHVTQEPQSRPAPPPTSTPVQPAPAPAAVAVASQEPRPKPHLLRAHAPHPSAPFEPAQPVAAEPAPPSLLPATQAQSSAAAIAAFEHFYRYDPDGFAAFAEFAAASAEVRRALADLLTLSVPSRNALIQILQMQEDVRDALRRVTDLPPSIQQVLRTLLT